MQRSKERKRYVERIAIPKLWANQEYGCTYEVIVRIPHRRPETHSNVRERTQELLSRNRLPAGSTKCKEHRSQPPGKACSHVHSLELKLADTDNLQVTVDRLRDELKKSYSQCLFLMQELESKEVELQNSNLCIEKLEESVSSMSLESQCEIESMKLDILALEQSCLEAKKIQEETAREKTRMNELIQELEVECQDARKITECLDLENKELREKLDTSETNTRIFCQRVETWLEKDIFQLKSESLVGELEGKRTFSTDMSTCGEVLESLFSKLAMVPAPDANLVMKMEKMSHQIQEYELLVKQLKEELRDEKSKAKEEAEDLAQEMAELRYQVTGLFEEECKRRAYIEQASLQRIAELEAQVQKERTKSFAALLSLDMKNSG